MNMIAQTKTRMDMRVRELANNWPWVTQLSDLSYNVDALMYGGFYRLISKGGWVVGVGWGGDSPCSISVKLRFLKIADTICLLE